MWACCCKRVAAVGRWARSIACLSSELHGTALHGGCAFGAGSEKMWSLAEQDSLQALLLAPWGPGSYFLITATLALCSYQRCPVLSLQAVTCCVLALSLLLPHAAPPQGPSTVPMYPQSLGAYSQDP